MNLEDYFKSVPVKDAEKPVVRELPAIPRTNAKLTTGNTCLCNSCGEYFSTVSNFDRHRTGPHGKKVCADPESVGLVIGQRGKNTVWRMPGLEGENVWKPF